MQPDPTGILLVDKPTGPTSHDVVDRVRRCFYVRSVGHCGTLDPMATGLLVLLLGKATKLSERLMGEDKEYEGTLKLGVATDSQDADGAIIAEKPVPPLTEPEIRAAFEGFKGDLLQTPPMVSAKKIAGVPLYKLARKGKEVERKPRLVHIYRFDVLRVGLPDVDFRLSCTKGTYVRTICHELGAKLGCGGHLSKLRRTASGRLRLENAYPLSMIEGWTRQELEANLIHPFDLKM
ncbi:MAG: tRNA pseudouridine(55) synthase TruB [Verrucomicrobia bacterium]|nr:tRNA pseudouridine(55) synthase TruB [Verrucomicrobiota bacterium]